MIGEESSIARSGWISERGLRALVVGIVLLLPVAAMVNIINDYLLIVAIHIFVFAIAVLSYDLLFGYTGVLSFGHALFFGGGAYGIALLTTEVGMSYFAAVPVSLIAVTVLAVGVGAISFQVSGVYFAIVTLSFAQIGYQLVLQFRELTGGQDGIGVATHLPEVGGIDLGDIYPAYALTLVVLALVYLATRRLVNSQFGRILQGIRENEARTKMLGINTYRYKLISFTLSGAIAAVAGIMYLFYAPYVDVSLTNWETTGDIVMMGLIGGFGTLWGGFFGTAFFVLAEEFLVELTGNWKLIFGAVFVLFVLFLPEGIASLFDEDASNPLETWVDDHVSLGDEPEEEEEDHR
jgi:branched-chain amino acid transport system permease protein